MATDQYYLDKLKQVPVCCKFGRTGFRNFERYDSVGMQRALHASRSV